MRRLRAVARRFKTEEGGYALPFIATTMILLLTISAFAVDLGWFYVNSGRLQRAVDSAALAGVVFLPHDVTNVEAKAVDGANANGYSIGTVNGTNIGSGPDDMTWSELTDNKLQVSVTSSVETFFLRLIGMDQLTLTRTATAQFIKPVPLGAPANCMGIGPGVSTDGLTGSGISTAWSKCSSYTQNFWSAINGRRTAKEHGDPYGPTCGYSCSGGNSDHDQYYYFAVDVPENPGNWVDVFLYDAGFYDRSGFAETGDEESLSNSSSGGTHMTFDLFEPDTTPGIPENNSSSVACSLGNDTLTVNSGSSSGTYRNRWARMCRISNPTEGIYVLRVSNGGSSIGGNNSYALLVNSDNFNTSNPPRVYSINEMSIFTNDSSGTATVYLAEVDPIHANKILQLTFYDPGEGAGNAQMTVLPPPGVSGYSCSWVATDVWPGGGPNSGNSCTINSTVSGNARYNGEWITMQIDLPASYTCTTDCFWKMELDLNVSHDRTTWEAKVIGNPVALVPNP